MVVYNSLAWAETYYIRVPIPISEVDVLDASFSTVSSQVVETDENDVLDNNQNVFTVVFRAEVAPLGYSVLYPNFVI